MHIPRSRQASLATAAISGLAALASLVSYAGCSSSDNSNSAADASPDGDLIVGHPDGGVCTSKSFGAPSLVPGLPVGASSARLAADELTIYFDNGNDLLAAKRLDRRGPFGAAAGLGSVSSPSADYSPWVSGDDKTLFFVSNRTQDGGGAAPFRLYRAQRSDTSAQFDAPHEVAGLPAGDIFEPFVRNGIEVWFSQETSTGRDLFHSPATGDSFGPAVAATELNDPSANEGSAMLSADGLVILFGSTRAPSLGSDIWMATRTDASKPFSPPANVSALNSAYNEGPGWLSPDGCRIYLTSDRPTVDGGPPGAHLYVAERAE